MPLLFAAFGCGLVFGIGLLVSGMNNPAKVIGFLDVFGAWDATLAFVMAGAVAVTAAGFAWARRRGHALLADTIAWPRRSDVDRSLVTGGVIFGIGWGLVGLCPGPALVDLAAFGMPIIMFVAAMGTGMIGCDLLRARGTAAPSADTAAAASDG